MLECPLPIAEYPTVTMSHGAGGRQSQRLLRDMILKAFQDVELQKLHDGATLEVEPGSLAFSTDSYVIRPRFFPGGNIGSLAVHGTINDLAMCGAQPLYLSFALILEEGLPTEELWRILVSAAAAAKEAGVRVVTGDTKVVERGHGDGVYINTAGVGRHLPGAKIDPRRAQAGDRILISGPIAEHGVAILSVRQGLEFDTQLVSDSAALHGLVANIIGVAGEQIHVLRDPTRGGVTAALNEVALSSKVGTRIEETQVPISAGVRGACELLGLDPLSVANEGRCLVWCDPARCDEVLAAMRSHPLGAQGAVIGEVVSENPGRVWARSSTGGSRLLDLPSGEQLPRIC